MMNLYTALCWHTHVHESSLVGTVEFSKNNAFHQEDTHWLSCCWKVHQILAQNTIPKVSSGWPVNTLTYFRQCILFSLLPVTVWLYHRVHKNSTLKCPVVISLSVLSALVPKYKSTDPFSVLFFLCVKFSIALCLPHFVNFLELLVCSHVVSVLFSPIFVAPI